MKTKRVRCYLRTHRRAWGLTQSELASLLGLSSGTQVSRIEKSKRAPGLATALACQVIFGISPAELFPHAYAEVEERTIRQIYLLHQNLEKRSTSAELRKWELCEGALKRATTRANNQQGV